MIEFIAAIATARLRHPVVMVSRQPLLMARAAGAEWQVYLPRLYSLIEQQSDVYLLDNQIFTQRFGQQFSLFGHAG